MFGLKIKREGEHIVTTRTQYERPLILDTVQRVRLSGGVDDRQGLGRWALSIPFEDWIALREKFPELASNDPKIKSRAYLRFMRSPESLPFKMREKI
jgi:hypothetical protein